MSDLRFALVCFLLSPGWMSAADWQALFNHKDLSGWEVIGDGLWNVTSDGLLTGQRNLKTAENQSWLYTKEEFDQFDLRVEYWLRFQGNSGISIRDSSRAQYAVGPNADLRKTPAHIGYEIQLQNEAGDPFPTGSVYLFDHAKTGVEKPNDWNRIEIRSRHSGITVLVNGERVSQYAGDPARPLKGPIGFQLHDRGTLILIKSVELRPVVE